jgi:hypothetical protein
VVATSSQASAGSGSNVKRCACNRTKSASAQGKNHFTPGENQAPGNEIEDDDPGLKKAGSLSRSP